MIIGIICIVVGCFIVFGGNKGSKWWALYFFYPKKFYSPIWGIVHCKKGEKEC